MSSRNADKFVVRLPDGLRPRIAAKAVEHNRSMNSEIVNALEFFFGDHTCTTIEPLVQLDPPWQPVVGQLVRLNIEGEDLPGVYVLEGLQAITADDGALEVQAALSDERGMYSVEPFKHLRPFTLKIGEGIAGTPRKV